MKRSTSLLCLGLILSTPLVAQTADDLNEGFRLSHDSSATPNPYSLKWWGRSGYFYFIQQTEDLREPFNYFPYAVMGSDGIEGIDFDTNAEMIFFRLRYTNDTQSELYLGDFDGDNVANGDELVQSTSPFEWFTTDGDLMADDWELFWFGDLDEVDATNADGDFTINLEESELGLDPTADERGKAITYTYNAVGRLTQASNDSVTLTYTLDEEGNILSKN